MSNRIETAAAVAGLTPLEIQEPGLPVACLFAGIIRAIACQAELARAARFNAQRQNFYKAVANDVVRGPGFVAGAPAIGTPADLADRSSDELLAILA
ncbi:hypothetical protein [Amycolatopsis tolypomycina]|uniref:Uncharacterized protein n=1 Tax=Amycolatopsis tolypomycina TaxID=208445 RepID=A0A1H4W1D8_9PSEU|nr:hypothetical protein [Amycolatopsis tolypomycina]SEC86471.1 hypothetical protein SAMN04489727_5382 [Amycolatopsis tolypomycina]